MCNIQIGIIGGKDNIGNGIERAEYSLSWEYVKVAEVSQVPEGGMKMVMLGNEEVLLANVRGNFYAIGNTCTHMDWPLSDGELEGFIVTCPGHAGQFDVRTGEVVSFPPRTQVPAYEVKIDGISILLRKRK